MNSPVLTTIQIQLRNRIADAVQREACNRIEYHCEWLGYLPFGCYQWVKCNGKDVDLVLSEDWGTGDLAALEQSGFLETINDSTNPDDELERTILYLVRS